MKYLSSKVRRWIGLAFCPAAVSCNCYRSCPLEIATIYEVCLFDKVIIPSRAA
jgi:hypothetical protein